MFSKNRERLDALKKRYSTHVARQSGKYIVLSKEPTPLQIAYLRSRWSDTTRGYSKYQEYLDSAEWKIKKLNILSTRGTRCEDCKSTHKAVQLHHLTYERLGDELPEDLVVLCASCHKQRHSGNVALSHS